MNFSHTCCYMCCMLGKHAQVFCLKHMTDWCVLMLQTPQSQAVSGPITTQVTVVRPQTTSGQSTRQQSSLGSVQSSQSPSQPSVVTRPTLATSQMVVQTTQRTPQQLTLASTATTTTPTTTPIITARTTTSHTILSNR